MFLLSRIWLSPCHRFCLMAVVLFVAAAGGAAGAADATKPAVDPKSEELRKKVIGAFLKFRDDKQQEAMEDLDKLIAEYPGKANAYSMRADLKLDLDDADSAFADADKAVSVDPTFIEAYEVRARANLRLGKYAEAVRDYETQEVPRLLRADREKEIELFSPRRFDNSLHCLGYGTALYCAGELDRAHRAYEWAGPLNYNQDYKLQAAILKWVVSARFGAQSAEADQDLTYQKNLQVGNIEEYEQKRKRVKFVQPSEMPAKPFDVMISRYLLGEIADDQLLGQTRTLDKKEYEAGMCRIYFYSGIKHLVRGDYVTAQKRFKVAAAARAPDTLERVLATHEVNRLATVEKQVTDAIMLMDQRKFTEAIQVMDKLGKFNYTHPLAHLLHARYQQVATGSEIGIEEINKSLEMGLPRKMGLLVRGYLYMQNARFEQAIKDYEEALGEKLVFKPGDDDDIELKDITPQDAALLREYVLALMGQTKPSQKTIQAASELHKVLGTMDGEPLTGCSAYLWSAMVRINHQKNMEPIIEKLQEKEVERLKAAFIQAEKEKAPDTAQATLEEKAEDMAYRNVEVVKTYIIITDLDEKEMAAFSDTPNRAMRCAYNYYLGMKQLAAGKSADTAKPYFQKAIKSNSVMTPEYVLALGELKRMGALSEGIGTIPSPAASPGPSAKPSHKGGEKPVENPVEKAAP
ncbi:MAG TPA: hypothetical protein VK970_25550 [Candidatus Methylacidiphilales bacterium]|nr:hypothetical protein [Candidatus Methylacidiphilales bacterium]